MSHADTYGEGGTQTQAEHERDRKKESPYTVCYWGSHPDDNNDDCFVGYDFADMESAVAFFKGDVQDPANLPGYYITSVAFIEIDGIEDAALALMGMERVRPNPKFKKSSHRDDNDEWKREIANEAGMLHGVEAYNEAMGYD